MLAETALLTSAVTAIAFTVSVVLTLIGALYSVEEAVGVDPSVV